MLYAAAAKATFVIGDKEVEEGTVAVRRRGEGDIGAMNQDEFIAMLQKEIAEKR